MKPIFSASIMCMDFLNIERDMQIINSECDMYHADIMDGHFAKNITCSPDVIKSMRKATSLPIDAHLMLESPDDFIDAIAEAGADYISLHAETINTNAFRIISRIEALGKKVGIVLNPATPLDYIRHYIHKVDLLTIMTVDVGFGGQPYIKEMEAKISEARDLRERENYSYIIQIDGSCNPATYAGLSVSGGEAFVMGSSGLFRKGMNLKNSAQLMRREFSETTGIDAAKCADNNNNFVVAVDVGGTNIRIGLVDELYSVHSFEKAYRKEVMSGENPAEKLGEYICKYISDNCSEKPSAVVVGVPSTLDKNRKIVMSTPNIQGMNNIPLVEILENIIKTPVFIERDVTLLFQNDYEKYKLPAEGVAIGVYLGTGLGNAIYIDGKPLVGADGAAGEIGHIPVLGENGDCGCGNNGCIELFAGGKYLEKTAAENNAVSIDKIFVQCGDSEPVLKYLDAVAVAVSSAVNILNPSAVVIGGGVPMMEGFSKDKLEKLILKHTRKPCPASTLKITWSEDGDMNGVIGGGIFAHKKLKG